MPNRAIRSAVFALGLSVLAAACNSTSPHEISLPVGAVEIAAPAVYQEWHAKTQSCSGRTGNFSTLKFYVVPGVDAFPTYGGAKVGEWVTDGSSSRIVVAGNYRDHEMVVRHEILHSILKSDGHPPEYFVNRCRLTWESWNGPRGTVALGGID